MDAIVEKTEILGRKLKSTREKIEHSRSENYRYLGVGSH